MKTCPKCGAQIADEAAFCTVCGFSFAAAAPQGDPAQGAQAGPAPQYQQVYQAPPVVNYPSPVNPLDKFLGIMAMFSCLSPLAGFIGFIFAWYGGEVNGQRSEYLKFYANQAMVFALFSIIDALVGWAFFLVIPSIWVLFRFVCVIIAIVNACKGVAKPVLFFGTLKVVK